MIDLILKITIAFCAFAWGIAGLLYAWWTWKECQPVKSEEDDDEDDGDWWKDEPKVKS